MSRLKGFKLTEEHKRKIGEAHLGKKSSFKTLKKLSDSHRGKYKYPQLWDRKWLEEKYLKEGLRAQQICKIVGCTSPALYGVLKVMGFSLKGYVRGSTHWKWKGGISQFKRNNFAHMPEYQQWKKQVFIRDQYTCRGCNKKGGILHPHHILPVRDFWHLRFNVINGMSLCKKCHLKTVNKEYLFIQTYEKRGELLESLRILLSMVISSRVPKVTLEKVQRLIVESYKDNNANTSTPPERDDIVRTVGKLTEV